MAMVAADTPSHPWALSKGESVCEDCSRFTTVIFSLQSKIGLHIALPSLLASVESPMESSRSFAVSTMRVWALPPASLVASFNRAFLRSPWCFFPWFWNNPLGLPVLLGFWIGVATTLGDFVLLNNKKKLDQLWMKKAWNYYLEGAFSTSPENLVLHHRFLSIELPLLILITGQALEGHYLCIQNRLEL